MRKINNFLSNAYNKQIDGTGLAVFRIFYCIVLLCEIIQMYYFRHLIFDKIPFVEIAEIDFAFRRNAWSIWNN